MPKGLREDPYHWNELPSLNHYYYYSLSPFLYRGRPCSHWTISHFQGCIQDTKCIILETICLPKSILALSKQDGGFQTNFLIIRECFSLVSFRPEKVYYWPVQTASHQGHRGFFDPTYMVIGINPSNAETTLVKNTKTQRFLKNFLTLSCWYSLDSSHWILSRWAPICHGFSKFSMFSHHFELAKSATSSIRVDSFLRGNVFRFGLLSKLFLLKKGTLTSYMLGGNENLLSLGAFCDGTIWDVFF